MSAMRIKAAGVSGAVVCELDLDMSKSSSVEAIDEAIETSANGIRGSCRPSSSTRLGPTACTRVMAVAFEGRLTMGSPSAVHLSKRLVSFEMRPTKPGGLRAFQ